MDRKISLDLAALDYNAYSLLGSFNNQAVREGWRQSEIDAVLGDARSSDYAHMLQVLAAHCEAPSQTIDHNKWDSKEKVNAKIDSIIDEYQYHGSATVAVQLILLAYEIQANMSAEMALLKDILEATQHEANKLEWLYKQSCGIETQATDSKSAG